MVIPRWVIFVVAFWVMSFGAYRMSIAVRKIRHRNQPRANLQTKGLWAQSARRQLLFGTLYLILGGYLIVMGFGYGLDPRALFGF